MLPCGCAVMRTGTPQEDVPVTFASIACADHESARPDRLLSGTAVRIDLLLAFLAQER